MKKFDPIEAKKIRMNRMSGVYFLFNEEKIVYVGMSKNIYSRVFTHDHAGRFDAFNFIRCPPEKCRDIEIYYIQKYKPTLNIVGIDEEFFDTRCKTYNLSQICIDWLADEAKRLDTSASRLLNIFIKGKMNVKKQRKN